MIAVTCPQLNSVQAGSLVKESVFHLVSVARDKEEEVGGVSADSEVMRTHSFHIYFSTL